MCAQSCPTLFDPMLYRPSSSSVHGILWTRILSGLPFSSPVELPDARIKSTSPVLAEGFFISEHLGSPENKARLFKQLIVICTVPIVPVAREFGELIISTLLKVGVEKEKRVLSSSLTVFAQQLWESHLFLLSFHFLLYEEEIITLNSIGLVEINENHLYENKHAVDSEFAVVREPATTICIRQRLQRWARHCESFKVKEYQQCWKMILIMRKLEG